MRSVLLDPAGGDPVQVATGRMLATAGSCNPDGQHIVFTGGARLWSIGIDGSGLTALTSIPLSQVGSPSVTVVADSGKIPEDFPVPIPEEGL
jgi:hypothetical protein